MEQFREHARGFQEKDSQNDVPVLSRERIISFLEYLELAEIAGALDPALRFYTRVSFVEQFHEQRWLEGLYTELNDISERIEAIRHREGLEHDEYWPIGEGPEDYQKLNSQYGRILDAKFEKTLREFDLADIADLYATDTEAYDDLRERGRVLVYEGLTDLKRLGIVQKQFEHEADICAQGEAYHAAAIMIGSAIEAALLFACLNNVDSAGRARFGLDQNERPQSANPQDWRLNDLIKVTYMAGWLPKFKIGDRTLDSVNLTNLIRHLRNLAHPSRHLRLQGSDDIKADYFTAREVYSLITWHLAAEVG